MTKSFLGFLFLALLFSELSAARENTSISVTPSVSMVDITNRIEVGQSPSNVQDPSDVVFAENDKTDLVRGYSDQDLWIRFHLKNESNEKIEKLLMMTSPLSGTLSLKKGMEPNHWSLSGSGIPLGARAYEFRWGAFPISLGPQEESDFYLRRSSHHALNTRLLLIEPVAAEKNESLAKSIFFFYLGGILSLVIYNFSIGLFTLQKDHILYSLFAASFGTTAMTVHGIMDAYLFPNSILVFSNYLMFFSSLSLIMASLFVERFLNIQQDFKIGYWGVRFFAGAAFVSLLASFFVPHFRSLYFFGYWIDISIGLAITFFIFCGIYSRQKRNYVLANFFLLSWLVLFLGTSVWLSSLHGLIHITPFTQYSLLFANLGEMLVLSLGLAYKIKVLDQEKKAALLAAEEKDRYQRLVKVLTHDVANTLGGLQFHSEALKELTEDANHQAHAERIYNSTNKLDKMLRSVRGEEMLHSFKAHTSLKWVELNSACLEAIHQYSWELKEKNIKISLSVPPQKFVRADASALVNQVLSNLISNSIKFTEPGRCIHIFMEERKEQWVLGIQDEGTGIHPDNLNHIFKGQIVFTEKGTANEKGTGLGTSLVGEYMKLFGGQIEVTSVHRSIDPQSSGTTVRLIFPKS